MLMLMALPLMIACGDDDEGDGNETGSDLINKAIETIPVTHEMIAGTSWEVKSFTIARGSNSNLQNGKTVRFNEDGSCEVFHSMETAWRITNGRLETFYKQTNEPMFVYTLLSQTEADITVQMNGTLDDDLQATIILSKAALPNNVSVEESYWKTKEEVYAVRNSCCVSCATFVEEQLNLEKIRTTPNTVHQINPNSSEIRKAWEAGYTAIHYANILINYAESFKSLFTSQEYNELLAEVKFVRAFAYYNLTVLWGDVPFVTTVYSVDDQTSYTRYNKNMILEFALGEVDSILSSLQSQDNKLRVSHDAGLMLKAEMEMALGDRDKAIATLNEIPKTPYVNTRSTATSIECSFIWALSLSTQTNSYIPVYTLMHHQLYLYENTGSTEGLDMPIEIYNDSVRSAEPIEWYWLQSEYLDYGYWAALKRIGKAMSVTNCYDYELLMPLPSNDIMFNPSMTQNPGY